MLLFANVMNANERVKQRKTGAVSTFIENLQEAGRITFDASELVNTTGLSVIAAKNQLQRLQGHVARVSRHHAFFLIVEPQYRPIGSPPVEWWIDAYFRWLGHPYYLALQSAAELYNSSPQAILVKQIITDSPRRDISIGRTRIRFFVKRGVAQTPVKQPPNAYAPLRVSSPEATALDIIRYASRIGGMGRALETIMPLVPLFRTSGIKSALNTEGKAAIAQRLGYLMETAGQKQVAEIIHQWLPSRIVRVPLETSQQVLTETAASRRWRLLVSEGDTQP